MLYHVSFYLTTTVQNGTIELRQALAGFTVHGAVVLWDDGLLRRTADGEWAGFHFELMSELANLGGFDFVLHEHPFAPGYNWNDWLVETLNLYDANIEYWMATSGRAEVGAFPIYGFFDTSSQFVTHVRPIEEKNEYFSFMAPLANEVWYALLVASFLTGMAYLIAEWGENEDDLNLRRDGCAAACVNTTFLSLFTVTGGGTFTPKTWPGKLVTWSWAWLILLFVSAYTANLAAYLIMPPPSALVFSDVYSAIHAGARICVWDGTAQLDQLKMLIQKESPKYKGMVVTSDHPLEHLKKGDCDAAVAARPEVESALSSIEGNPCCTMTAAGPDLSFTEGAWMVKSDYLDKCTSLVRDVIYLLTSDLGNSGKLQEIVDGYSAYHSDNHCVSQAAINSRCPNGVAGDDDAASGNATRRLSDLLQVSARKLKGKGKGGGAAAGGGAGGAVAEEGGGGGGDDEISDEGMGIEAFVGMFLVHGVFLLFGVSSRTFHFVHNLIYHCRGGDSDDGTGSANSPSSKVGRISRAVSSGSIASFVAAVKGDDVEGEEPAAKQDEKGPLDQSSIMDHLVLHREELHGQKEELQDQSEHLRKQHIMLQQLHEQQQELLRIFRTPSHATPPEGHVTALPASFEVQRSYLDQKFEIEISPDIQPTSGSQPVDNPTEAEKKRNDLLADGGVVAYERACMEFSPRSRSPKNGNHVTDTAAL
eukprot:TRINITY_DN10641_c0_g1_i1.p1 TRINITY_DN10641_c0_g1~~TRINITY_DN10641_c0_g1_i1.p1  ORF type:complete len:704 (-),score=102.34 TRINITY_DN10641_c0_g1_i1:74-2185(-)